jgi:hypothetical protein
MHLTLKSANVKTGPIPVSTSSAETCPDACPLKNKGCYAFYGNLARHWRKVTSGERGGSWRAFIRQVANLPTGQLWRHNQAGDLPGVGDVIDAGALAELVQANKGKRGFCYTHKPVFGPHADANRRAIATANAAGLVVNLSANNVAEADKLDDLDLAPVVTILPSDAPDSGLTPAGRRWIVCPAESYGKTCADCQLCARQRSIIIGFRAHGQAKATVNQLTQTK